MELILKATLEILAQGGRGALATVTRTSGSTPQRPGSRLLLRPDGTALGTVGGGAIEQAVIEELHDVRRTNQARYVTHELGYDLGMCCGGRMELFLEPIESAPRLVLFGAGHIARPTAALARNVGFEVSVVDEREELNTEERFPGCTRQLTCPTSFLRGRPLTPRDWLVIVTHDHRLDEETLALALGLGPRYIGLVGSRRKVFRLMQRIGARQGQLALDRVYAPVGLDIGAIGPEEIAVSIVGELVALRRGTNTDSHLRAVQDTRLLRILADGAEADGGSDPDADDADAPTLEPPPAEAENAAETAGEVKHA
jgi:xanthine dehydrogenase accessory factor